MTCELCKSARSAERAPHFEKLSGSSDEELMVRFQKGCNSAFDELYRRYYARIAAYLTWRTGEGADEARDLANATFARIVEKNAKYDPVRGRFAPWLYRIARNTAVTASRRLPHLRSVGAFREWEACQQADIAADVELRQCINRLADQLKEVVELAFFAGLTDREAGEVLGIPAGTVASRKHRAIAELRNALLRPVRQRRPDEVLLMGTGGA
jgi:RNA polymerase sigma-70 factor (ECF subfamily)